MALIQLLKDLLPIRREFQKAWIRQWLKRKHAFIYLERPTGHYLNAERELVQLATDGDSNAFYSLPIEQLCGQMNAAAQSVLDHPRDYPSLLLCLASQAAPADIDLLFSGPPPPPPRPRDGVPTTDQQPVDDTVQREMLQDFVDARNRVTHQVQRAIDALQLSAGSRWKLSIQIGSIILSGGLAVLGVSLFGDVHGFWHWLLTVFIVALLGGFFAPIARDLIAGLQRLRS
jgi:hypothetical protein